MVRISTALRLSIITINLNNKTGLDKTIQSVVSQNFEGFEFIVIDGGSTDGSAEYIEQNKAHFSYWFSEKDKGIYYAMNKGIDKAIGEYIIFMNSGDCLVDENVLQTFANSKPTEKILYGSAFFIKGDEIVKKKVYPASLDGMELMYWTINHQCIFFHKSVFADNVRYNTDYKYLADWVLYMDAIFKKNADYRRLDFPVAYYDYSGITSNELILPKLDAERNKYYIENADIFIPHFLEEHKKQKQILDSIYDKKNSNIFFRIFRKFQKWLSIKN